jgi:WD40 repeat protein
VSDAFVSYSRRDSRKFVERLLAAFEQRGKDPWVDLEDIPPASEWERDLREGVAGSNAFCFVISPGSIASEHCLRELAYASERNKRIIPINYVSVPDADVPEPVSTHNWVPQQGVFDDDFEAAFETLMEAIETDLEWVRAHTRWGERAEEWKARGRDNSLLARGSDLVAAEQFIAQAADRQPAPTELQGEYVIASRGAASRRQRLTISAVSAALLVAIGLAVFAFLQRQTAIDQREAASSRALAANAFLNLSTDPELSLLLGLEAADAKPTREAEDALRTALLASRVRTVLRGHRGAVTSAQFSPRDDAVLTSSTDQTAGIWNPGTGERTTNLDGHKEVIPEAVYSPDGSEVLTYAQDSTARVWNADDGTSVAVLSDPDDVLGRLQDAAFSPDGKLVATAPFVNSTIKVWNVDSGRMVRELPQDLVDQLAFSPDGRLLLTAEQDKGASLWRVANGGRMMSFADDAQTAFSFAGFSPDGRLFATAGEDGFVRVRDLGGEIVATLRHQGPVLDVAFSPDGSRIATSSADGTARVWDADTGEPVSTFNGHGAAVDAVDFSPDGSLVASGGDDGRGFLWDPDSGAEVAKLVGHQALVGDIDFSPDGGRVVTASADGTARIWSASPTGGAFEPGADVPASTSASEFSDDGARALLVNFSRITVLDTQTLEKLSTVELSGGETALPALSADGRLVVTTTDDGADPQIRNTTDGSVVADLAADSATAADFSTDCSEVAIGGRFGTAGIYNTSTGERLRSFVGHNDRLEIESIDISPDTSLVATTSLDRSARVWNARSGEQLIEVTAFTRPGPMIPPGEATSANFSPNSEEFVTSSLYENDAHVWDASTGDRIATLEGETNSLVDARFSPSGRFLLTGSFDGRARLWEGDSGRLLSLVTDFPGSGDRVGFTPDEREVLMVTTAIPYEHPPGKDAVRTVSCDVCGPIETLEGLARDRVTRELTETERDRFLSGD